MTVNEKGFVVRYKGSLKSSGGVSKATCQAFCCCVGGGSGLLDSSMFVIYLTPIKAVTLTLYPSVYLH